MVIGIDVGFSSVKVVSSGKKVGFPSVVGTPIPQSAYSLRSRDGLAIREGGGNYTPVGETAFLQSRYTAGRRDSEWVLSDQWMTLFLAGLSETISLPRARVKVVVGLPVRDWSAYATRLRARLERKITFQRLGREQQTAEIKEALVVTQPYGSLLSMALGQSGQLFQNVWSQDLVAVADLGGNTLNLLAVDQLEEVSRWTLSDEFGLLHALDGVRDDIRSDFGRFNPSTHEVAQWLAEGSFRYMSEDVKIWPYAKTHLEPLIRLVMARMDEAWQESSRFDAVLLTGGGAAAIGRYLKEQMLNTYGHVEIARDPRWANAVGYYRLGLFALERDE